jgi:CubicO group peptidase (beta-lactamase class C family)
VVPMRSHWSYNNAGFYVLGRVIEVVSGQTYESAVTELVLRPLGMDHTFFTANEVMTHRFSTGYVKVGDDFVVQRPWMMMRSAAPAGSTCSSSAEDMTKYARYLLAGTLPGSGPEGEPAADVPPPEAAESPDAPSPLEIFDRTSLWAPVRGIGDSLNGFPGDEGMIGQAWFLDQYPDALIISHGGTTMGHQSDFWVSPDRQVGFIAMTNASSGHLLNRKLSEWTKREVLGLSAPTRDPLPMGGAELAGLSGTYFIPGQPLQITSQVEHGQLTFSVPDSASGEPTTAPLQVIAPDRALIIGGEMEGFGVEFLRDSKGGIDFIRFSGRLFPRETQPGK